MGEIVSRKLTTMFYGIRLREIVGSEKEICIEEKKKRISEEKSIKENWKEKEMHKIKEKQN